MRLQEYADTLSLLPLDMPVEFADGRSAGPLTTWRGDYSKLTIPSSREPSYVAGLLMDAKEVLAGKDMIGYKGGVYTMNGRTALYADDYGEYAHYIPSGIYISEGKVIISTLKIPEYAF